MRIPCPFYATILLLPGAGCGPDPSPLPEPPTVHPEPTETWFAWPRRYPSFYPLDEASIETNWLRSLRGHHADGLPFVIEQLASLGEPIVPALLAEMKSQEEGAVDAVSINGVRVLAQIGSPTARAGLATVATDSRSSLARAAAVRALGVGKTPEEERFLVSLFPEADESLQAAILSALLGGSTPEAGGLIEWLFLGKLATGSSIPPSLLEALLYLEDPDAVARLKRLLTKVEGLLHLQLLVTLIDLGEPVPLADLQPWLADSGPFKRSTALSGAAKAGYWPVVFEAATDPDISVRAAVTVALAAAPDSQELFAILERLARDVDGTIALEATRRLFERGRTEHRDALVARLSSWPANDAQQALSLLSGPVLLGPDVAQALNARWESTPPSQRPLFLAALIQHGAPDLAWSRLEPLLLRGQAGTCGNLLDALGSDFRERKLAVFQTATDLSSRLQILGSLRMEVDSEVVRELFVQLAQDEGVHPALRSASIRALPSLMGAAARPLLHEMMMGSGDPNLRHLLNGLLHERF